MTTRASLQLARPASGCPWRRLANEAEQNATRYGGSMECPDPGCLPNDAVWRSSDSFGAKTQLKDHREGQGGHPGDGTPDRLAEQGSEYAGLVRSHVQLEGARRQVRNKIFENIPRRGRPKCAPN